MVLAEGGPARGDVVARGGELVAQAYRFVVRRAHAPEREVDAAEGGLAIDEGEALADGQLHRQPQEIVEHAGRGGAGVVLDRDHAREGPLAAAARRKLHCLPAEAHPAVGQIVGEIALGQFDRPHLRVEQGRQEFERLRMQPAHGVIDAEQPGPIGGEGGQQGVPCRVQRAFLGLELHHACARVRASPAPQQPAEGFGHAALALQRAADDRQEDVVAEQRLGAQAFGPEPVQSLAEWIRKGAFGHRIDPAAEDMVVEGEARGAERSQRGVAQVLTVVELVRVGGLERQAFQLQHLHQPAVAQQQGVVVDLRPVWKLASGAGLSYRAAHTAHAR
jgi:hypothetical protein